MLFFLIPSITSVSNQEDLSISNYSQIGCLILKSNKQYLINSIQTNSSLAYQTFSSSNMTIELCFRLCRRWIILIDSNHTNCICLYTINKPYQFQQYLGEISFGHNCTSNNNLQIYSLTKNFDLLPSLSSVYQWSLDGCYYLHGIQQHQANRNFTNMNYTQAINACRIYCQSLRNTNYLSFFLSLRKYCYCLPITPSKSVLHTALRKPLIHCSFLSYIKNSFDNFFNYSDINLDTVVKIDVERYCLSTYNFNQNLYLCLKSVPISTYNTYSKINSNETCSPILINRYEQWNYLLSFSFTLNTRTFIWIDRNSSYILNKLFKSKSNSFLSNDLCIVINQTNSNQSQSFDLLPCSTARWPNHILCAQKTLDTIITNEAEFMLQNEERYPIIDNITCPTEFVLFNNMCYYVHTSFVYNIQSGEEICSRKYVNSTLVRLNSHNWGNINVTRFLGRTYDDILLEFFYYQLEKTMKIESTTNTTKKHWLRLLFEDKTPGNECVLRYFIHSLGAYTLLHRCSAGGHPVCQCEAIQKTIPKIKLYDEFTTNSLEINNRIDSTTTTPSDIILPILANLTNSSILSNESIIRNNTDRISDEDLLNNETNLDYRFNNNTLIQSKSQSTNYQPILMMIAAPLLALIMLGIGAIFFLPYIRRSRGSYSTGNNILSSTRRLQRSSTETTSIGKSNPPAVLYSKLRSSLSSTPTDINMLHPFDNSITIEDDDDIQLLPQTIKLPENIIPEDEEESLYASILKHSIEKSDISLN
ncbi:unnamed protein product [Adineta steineri]|uniref:Uncharacterized protein n=1 Tax=Adineta steineri TaxID=433720 RepID=A0A815DAT2_9BILA|nr:unnamed protein product [Adineta steineri]CAF4082667.1 unnamed protein product [Adineta steineri]